MDTVKVEGAPELDYLLSAGSETVLAQALRLP
jgi:hypothetical protein